ncbi:MAG: GHMP kinase [Acidobacteriia bacterium]|nr:GHMP kinase [Terriglobia bacterium]
MRSGAIEASAPTRIDLAGGTLDIWPLSLLIPGAITVNLAVDLRARAFVAPRKDRLVVVVSRDRGLRVTRKLPLNPGEGRGPLSLLLRLAAAFEPGEGLTLVTEADAPAGAGLGGSSALGIAVGAALSRFTGAGLRREALLRRVMNVEAAEIATPTGNQDYLAAIHGGLAAYHHGFDGTAREALAIPAGLEERLVLAYTGEPRGSGISNWDMFRRAIERERQTTRGLEAIASLARELHAALRERDLDSAGRILGEEGRLRYRLAPSVATPALLRAGEAARRAGAAGVKACGAGGGGCLVAFARAGKARDVSRALGATGARVLEFRIARAGVRVGPPRGARITERRGGS